LQQQLGVTTIFVKHDQEEAMTISDRIAVMNAGRVEQVGTPREIYDRPRTRFVGDLIGEGNPFAGGWRAGAFDIKGKGCPPPAHAGSGKARIAVRAERIRLTAVADAPMTGRVQAGSFVSGQMNYRIALDDGHQVIAKEAATSPERVVGETVGICWNADDVVVL